MEPCVKRGLKVVALPMGEEAPGAPSDTAWYPEILREECLDVVNFDAAQQGWQDHRGELAVEPAALRRRATKLRRWIKARPEKEVVLVAHGFFTHSLTGDVDEHGQ